MVSTLFTGQTPALPNINEGVAVTVGNTVGFAVPGTTRSRFMAPTTLGAGTYQLVQYKMIVADGGGGTGAGTVEAIASVPLGVLTGGQWSPWFDMGAVTDTDTYVYGLRTSEGRYAATGAFWTAPIVSGDITGFQNGTSRPALGGTVYNGRFGSGLVNFPNQTFNSNGYFVDVELTPSVEPAEGDAALGVVLALAGAGSRASAAAAALGLGLAVSAAGARESGGAADIGLGLAAATTGARPSLGSAALTLDLALATAGGGLARGAAAFTLGLELSADGPGSGCSSLPSFPWTCVSVPSFSEVRS